MRARDLIDFVLLAALWGASFLFMRVAAPEFGPFALMFMRCAIGAAVLLTICLLRGSMPALGQAWQPVAFVGLINSAIPFALFGYAALQLPAGMISVLNSTAPFFGVLIAFAWLGERLSRWQTLGLLLGFTGVVGLIMSGGRLDLTSSRALYWGVAAALLAAASYGLAASFMRRYLSGIDSLAGATGSQLSATVLLALPGLLFWPAEAPSMTAWLAVIVLGTLSTGLAYLLYFRLIANMGPGRAITVTFAIPVFGIFWGAVVLGELVTGLMVLGAVLVVAGCALTTGALPLKRRAGDAAGKT